jgi:hypothetical protein
VLVTKRFRQSPQSVNLEQGCPFPCFEPTPIFLLPTGPGDFFLPHVDTPIDPKFFVGTVVVCLPSQFTGGELVAVTHGQTSQTFDFAPRSSEKDVFQFAAFYGDCPHEIRHAAGNRVTLTYQIVRERPTPEYDGSDDEARYWAVRTRVLTRL